MITAPDLGDVIEATQRLQPKKASLGQARRFVARSLADWDRPAEVEAVVLLTSEVVTNAVLHAGPHKPNDEILLSVDRTADLVRVEVTDAHPNRPTIGTPDRLSGRGLLFLDTLAHAWGVLPNEVGKVVWFEVKASPSSPAGEPVGLPGETRRTPSARPGREPLGRAVEPGVLP